MPPLPHSSHRVGTRASCTNLLAKRSALQMCFVCTVLNDMQAHQCSTEAAAVTWRVCGCTPSWPAQRPTPIWISLVLIASMHRIVGFPAFAGASLAALWPRPAASASLVPVGSHSTVSIFRFRGSALACRGNLSWLPRNTAKPFQHWLARRNDDKHTKRGKASSSFPKLPYLNLP